MRPTQCGYVGASRIKDVMAGGQGKTRDSFMAEVIAARLTGQWPDSYCSPDMQRGIDLEATAADVYEFVTGNEVAECSFIPHPSIEMAGATPDRFVGDDGLLEIKCPKVSTHIKYLLAYKMPVEYAKQVQWQMACTGRKWVDFVSYCPELGIDLQLFVVRVDRDDDKIKEMEEAVIKFNQDVDETIKKLKEKK